jgi:hypothetical protein
MRLSSKIMLVSVLLGFGSAHAAAEEAGRSFGSGEPLRLAQKLPSDVEQRLGVRPNSANRDGRDRGDRWDRRDRDDRWDRRDRDRWDRDDRWERRAYRPGFSVTIPFGAPGYFVRTLPEQYRYVVVGGRRCRITVTRRVDYRGRVVTTERRRC